MADKLIEKLELIPYPGKAGYFFKETFRSSALVKPLSDSRIREQRSAITTIFLLLTRNVKYGIWHNLKSEETFFHHRGSSVRLVMINADGEMDVVTVGDGFIKDGVLFHYTVPANCWFNFALSDDGNEDYGLFGIGVAPGFELNDRATTDSKKLTEEFPQHKVAIEAFTDTKK